MSNSKHQIKSLRSEMEMPISRLQAFCIVELSAACSFHVFQTDFNTFWATQRQKFHHERFQLGQDFPTFGQGFNAHGVVMFAHEHLMNGDDDGWCEFNLKKELQQQRMIRSAAVFLHLRHFGPTSLSHHRKAGWISICSARALSRS